MRAQENQCQIGQNDILHIKFAESYLCFHNIILVIFETYFLRLP